MTREEAAIIIKECKDKGFKHTFYTLNEYHTALDMAIKALEQEPCEDCISRQAVDTLVDELARAISDERCCISRGRSTATIMQDILDLPPVNPQPKIGWWIDDKCSVCGKGIEDLIDSREWYENEEPNFCPFCGCRLVEPQERSDKE